MQHTSKLTASQHDPTRGTNPDGLTTVVADEDMYVYGGWDVDRVWKLNLPDACWTEHITTGDVPPARMNHAAAFYQGYMLVTGGERLQPPSRADSFTPLLPYYELACDTFEWMAVECLGSVPANRSHHTANVVGETLIVFGGKPADGRPLTATGMGEAKRSGFFDLHILQIISRTWRRVEMYDPASPMLWAHSSTTFRNSFLLLCGGFDVSTPEVASASHGAQNAAAIDAAPVATLTNVIHILKLDNMSWMRYTPEQSEPAPTPRAFLSCYSHGAELIMFGGMTVDHHGRSIHMNDCWTWSIEFGRWNKLEFCIPSWPSNKLISGVHGNQLLICPELTSLLYLDMYKRGTGWQRLHCTAPTRPIEPPRVQPHDDDEHAERNPRRSNKSSEERSAGGRFHHDGQHQDTLAPPNTRSISSKSAEYESEVGILRDEVARLRAQVKQQDTERSRMMHQHQLQLVVAEEDASSPPIDPMDIRPRPLQQWGAVAGSPARIQQPTTPKSPLRSPVGGSPTGIQQPTPRSPLQSPVGKARKSPTVARKVWNETAGTSTGTVEAVVPTPYGGHFQITKALPASGMSSTSAARGVKLNAAEENERFHALSYNSGDAATVGRTGTGKLPLMEQLETPSTLPSLSHFQRVRRERAALAETRKEKIAVLQQRLAQMESAAGNRPADNTAQLVKSLREETRRLESAATDTGTSMQTDSTRASLTRPETERKAQQHTTDRGDIPVSSRAPRRVSSPLSRGSRTGERPLLYGDEELGNEVGARASSTVHKKSTDIDISRSGKRNEIGEKEPSRSDSPLAEYWRELEAAIAQAPIVARPHD